MYTASRFNGDKFIDSEEILVIFGIFIENVFVTEVLKKALKKHLTLSENMVSINLKMLSQMHY